MRILSFRGALHPGNVQYRVLTFLLLMAAAKEQGAVNREQCRIARYYKKCHVNSST